MRSPSKMILHNVAIDIAVLRQFLIKSHYFMSYDPVKETVKLSVNDGGGGESILEIRDASWEAAQRLAELLDLKPTDDMPNPTSWSRYIPTLKICHDGSPLADMIEQKLYRSKIPFKVVRNCPEFEFRSDARYTMSSYDRKGLEKEALRQIEEIERDYKEILSTKP
ncbi:MAG: hypothetical protein UW46_C0017G0005 [Candidatus Yanofskybacteria bacterium GW2011_GWF1_44_227]|uniref:Uncharacterized protein n=1 Tax=Candidatus Yanofskybacteria bacterium GW2011_GWE2_40_11 TaxID=1619033 RepID=A0A0G0QKE9_9BACT|nr:MAG: hypothetical protein UT69_C0020G0014 [Candidatus Yanofskybacteria bacterium GW2011_GWE1_40_10]KKR40899.1 MAG: hypothetical protein UT75_C0003G0029 [Candidatus Yanofskybacteria bacterium GW2011_GWE2_40_11]KKT52599.1 MAG: hypothetical protein UW46_C0017G0005 [Candidatus Yanofskybacteria bacterium GW2011_GWF1_44_227]OGN37643.1 MAG: hypothetical protein A2371_00835 [Candidatus Yanofskybacteria bacterium RIFOXYB1_FULL_44_29]HBX58314.1 hypothetical protein [Candidatus Yanofskybacteria bacteri